MKASEFALRNLQSLNTVGSPCNRDMYGSPATPPLRIQSLACYPHSTSPRSKSPPFPLSPPKQSPLKLPKTLIRASLPELVIQHEKIVTADANIATMSACAFAFPRPLVSIYNVDTEANLVESGPASCSPEGKNNFLACGQRSKSTQKLCFRRVRKDRFNSQDLKSPSLHLRQSSEIQLNRFISLPKVLHRVKSRKVTWLAEPLSGQMAGYSLLKRQRLKRKATERSARTPHSPMGDLRA